MGKSTVSSTPAAYYEAFANSNTQIAQMEQDQSQKQLDWSKQQYADIAPYEKNYLQQASDSAAAQTDQAKSQWGTYQNTYLPLEKQFADKASTWDSPARADQQSGAAQADVASQYEQARKSATSSLESYGIDPSQTRFGALDLGTRISQAAASAGAGTQARTNTEATGLALMGEAINTGRGYSSAVSQAYSGATTAGSSGVTAGLNTSNTYGNLMGTPVQWSGQANATRGVQASALQGYGNFEIGATDENNAAASAPWKTAASLIGAIGSAAKV